MKCRDRLRQMCEYDILCMMQKNISASSPLPDCVLSAIVGEDANYERRDFCDSMCESCIAKWLNEPYDGRW